MNTGEAEQRDEKWKWNRRGGYRCLTFVMAAKSKKSNVVGSFLLAFDFHYKTHELIWSHFTSQRVSQLQEVQMEMPVLSPEILNSVVTIGLIAPKPSKLG